ncbi:SAF domain-containing protein [Micromonospora sp. DT81.3]|uniref:SAF domain-containing protein n=1 Tax=Micromonospora sp. DT81.3 TaxID=3416523 RepID=UPI003CEFBDAA
MSTTTSDQRTKRGKQPADQAQQPEPRQAAILRPTKSRRRPVIIALGVALALLGGVGTWWVTTNLTRTVSVMATGVDVARGETITAEDLTTIQLAGGQQVDSVPATDAAEVVGSTALVDLPAGTLITSANTGNAIAVASGESIVGVSLTQAQMPGYPLAAGDQVRVVETPVTQGDPPAETPRSFEATVFTTRFDAETGVWVVDLVVPEREAADIAARASTGRVALVIDATGE